MAAAAMKYMASNFANLVKFEGVDFRRWQKKIHFLLSSMSVVYVLTTPIPNDGGDNPTVKQVRKRAKWDNNDYVCRGLILNGMSDSQNVESSKELWDSLKAKYMADDASSKKFLVSNFINYKTTDSRLVLEQYNELLDFKHTLKHLKEKLTLVELGSHLRIKESLRVQDNDKLKGKNVVGPSVVNMVEHNNSSRYNDNKGKRVNVDNKANGSGTKGSMDGSSSSLKAFMTTSKLNDSILWHARLGHDLHADQNKKLFQNIKHETEVLELIHSDLCDLHATPSLENKKYFVTSIDDASRPSLRIPIGTKDIGGLVIPKEVVQQPEPKLRKCKRNRTLKDFGPGFQLYLIEGTRDEKEAINDEMDSIMGNNSWVVVVVVRDFYKKFYNSLGSDDDVAWWVDSGAIVHVSLAHGRSCVDLRFSSEKIVSLLNVLHVPNIRKNLVSSSVLNNCGYKQVIESNKFVLSKHAFMATSKLNDSILCHAKLGHVHFKRMQDMSKDGLILAFDMDTKKFVRLPDTKLKTLGERGIKCIFVGYVEHSKAFRPSLRIPNGTKDIGGSVVPKEVTEEDDPKTFDEAMKSRDVAF
ncbi:hypothetical protein Tco_1378255 [Tanacetum coccineum]